jgi:hypothetical protein
MVKRFEGGADLVTAGEDETLPRGRRLARLGARVLARGLTVVDDSADPYGSLRLYRLFTLARALSDLASPDDPLVSHEGWAANSELLLRVWPHVRRAERVPFDSTFGRRYRSSRFHALGELRGLMRAARDPVAVRTGRFWQSESCSSPAWARRSLRVPPSSRAGRGLSR